MLKRIVIAGSGLEGWMTAAALARLGMDGLEVTVVGPVPDTEPLADVLLPASRDWPKELMADDAALLADDGGAFLLGTALAHWNAPGETGFRPFGDIGAGLGPLAFPHIVARLRAAGADVRIANFSLAALAAQAGRFTLPSDDPRSILSSLAHGYVLDRARHRAYWQREAERLGVTAIAPAIERIVCEDDRIISEILTDGRQVEADLYIDCSGPDALLIGTPEREDWTGHFGVDVSASAAFRDTAPPLAYAVMAKEKGGWRRTLTLPGLSVETFYAPDDTDPLPALLAGRETLAIGEPRVTRQRYWRSQMPWRGNCLALGGAALSLAPEALADIHLFQSSLARFISLLPSDKAALPEAAEYNRRSLNEWDRARDFALLHRQAATDEPETLAAKRRLFESRSRVVMYDDEPFDETAWFGAFEALGIRATGYNPVADGFEPEDLARHLTRARAAMIEAVKAMPDHADALAQIAAQTDTGSQ